MVLMFLVVAVVAAAAEATAALVQGNRQRRLLMRELQPELRVLHGVCGCVCFGTPARPRVRA
eukprot:5060625-Pleurochrysis_carterae.AAC.1